jgi:ADP-ribosylglycohydrolase
MDESDLVDKAVGCLSGMVVGDALGRPVNGMKAYDVMRFFQRVDGFYVGKDCDVEYSGFSQLALYSSAAMTGACQSGDLTGNFPELFRKAATKAAPKAKWGKESREGIDKLVEGTPFQECGSETNVSAEVSALAIPVGIVAAATHMADEEIPRTFSKVARVVCRNRGGLLAGSAVAYMVRELIRNGDQMPGKDELCLTSESMVSRLIKFLRSYNGDGGLGGKLSYAARNIDRERTVREFVGICGNSGVLLESVPFSALCFLNRPGEFDAVIEAASMGGAASINASIVGAMTGAYSGSAAIPKSMFSQVKSGPRAMKIASMLSKAARGLTRGGEQGA